MFTLMELFVTWPVMSVVHMVILLQEIRILLTTTDDSQWKESMLPTPSIMISLMLQTAPC